MKFQKLMKKAQPPQSAAKSKLQMVEKEAKKKVPRKKLERSRRSSKRNLDFRLRSSKSRKKKPSKSKSRKRSKKRSTDAKKKNWIHLRKKTESKLKNSSLIKERGLRKRKSCFNLIRSSQLVTAITIKLSSLSSNIAAGGIRLRARIFVMQISSGRVGNETNMWLTSGKME